MALHFKESGSPRVSYILLLVFVAVSIALMTVYCNEGSSGPLHSAQNQVSGVLANFKLVGASGGAAVEGAAEALGDATASEDALSTLREQNKELTELLTQAEEYRLEAERLQGLLKIKETYHVEGVSGRVIGHSTDAWNQTITVDVGSDDGVEAGLTVLGPSGVVGQVTSVSSGSSVVRLLSDPASGVAAMIQSNRVEGIVRGSLSGLLYLENVDLDANVQVGDVVLTSGLGGSFTKGLLIGQVVRVDGAKGDDSRQIVVAQNEQVGSLEEIIVVFSASTSSGNGSNAIDVTASGQDGVQQ